MRLAVWTGTAVLLASGLRSALPTPERKTCCSWQVGSKTQLLELRCCFADTSSRSIRRVDLATGRMLPLGVSVPACDHNSLDVSHRRVCDDGGWRARQRISRWSWQGGPVQTPCGLERHAKRCALYPARFLRAMSLSGCCVDLVHR